MPSSHELPPPNPLLFTKAHQAYGTEVMPKSR